MKKEAFEEIDDWMKRCRGFTPVPREEKQTQRDYMAKNLNLLITDPFLVERLPELEDESYELYTHQKQIRDYVKRIPEHKKPGNIIIKMNRRLLEAYDKNIPEKNFKRGKQNIWSGTASKKLKVMDRYTGKLLWKRDAEYYFIHNGIAMAGDTIFILDRLPYGVMQSMKRRGLTPEKDFLLLALDVKTGEEKWKTTENIFGTWLGFSEKYDILLQAGRASRDMLPEPDDRIIAYKGKDKTILWDKSFKYSGPCLIHDKAIYTQTKALSLLTGEMKTRSHPLTGEEIPWTFSRNYGCNTIIGSENLLTFRSGAAGYYDLTTNGGTGNIGGFKSGCTSNLICAGGVLCAPDYTRTCTCSYQNQTSLGLVHMPDVETWTFNKLEESKGPVKRLALNFAAPGDRMTEHGNLWLEYPINGGPSPQFEVKTVPEKFSTFRKHSSRVKKGDLKWVAASGFEGTGDITVTLGNEIECPYTVRLVFAEWEKEKPGQRMFNVTLGGETVLEDFDIVKEAGGAGCSLVKEFKNIKVGKQLDLKLTPSTSAKESEPVICGIEIIAEE